MAYADRDGVNIYYEETGSGAPILFLHEYGGDKRSWEPQVRHFSRDHRCIVMCSRGYPPSDVPEDESLYGQDHANADAIAVMDAVGLAEATVIGLSMGAYTGLRLAIHHPDRVTALVAASGGAGSPREQQQVFHDEAYARSEEYLDAGKMLADPFANGPTRTQLKRKDIRGWTEFRDQLAEHPAIGAAYTLRHVQGERPSLYDFEAEFNACPVPTLLMVGDEDDVCLDVNVWLKRAMPTAGLRVFPKSGHLINLEDPATFNAEIDDFLKQTRAGVWPVREAFDGNYAGIGPR
ncbi:alpha/beta hydrolase [Thalassospiraceae bacterium LMO-JJ14]|nr:alpha/beta hydrolase [Thalassospiraceae bacterium LMO-JJ14]